MKSPLRHFLDISALPIGDLRTMLDVSVAMKQKRKTANGESEHRPLAAFCVAAKV